MHSKSIRVFLCVALVAFANCNPDSPREEVTISAVQIEASQPTVHIDIAPLPPPSHLLDAGVMGPGYVPPAHEHFENAVTATPPQPPTGLATISVLSVGNSGVGRVKITNPVPRAIPTFPDIVTDFDVTVLDLYAGTIPPKITRLGGRLGDDEVVVSEQPVVTLDTELFAVFFDDQHGKRITLGIPISASGHVVVDQQEISIASAVEAATATGSLPL